MLGMKNLSVIIFYNLMIISCASSSVRPNILPEQIRIIDLQVWLNLMPGGPSSFHIIGKYECLDNSNGISELKSIKVYSDSILICDISKNSFTCETEIMEDIQSAKYNFFTRPGIKLNEKIQTVDKINIKLIFNFNDDIIEKNLSNVMLTRAY